MSSLPASAVAEALAELDRLEQQRPALADAAALLRELLPALFAEPLDTPPLAFTAEQAATKLAAGIPLLRGEKLSLKRDDLERRGQAVCAAALRAAGDRET